METPRVRLGELLVESRIITRAQLQEVLERQTRDGRRLGTLLVESGLVTETQVTQILSQQLSIPWVSLHHIDFSRQLLNLVSQESAENFCLVPIFVRRVRGLGETLYVAMDDPTDEAAQREVSQYAGLPVRAMIAPPTDIRAAIRVYYGGAESVPFSEVASDADADVDEVAVRPVPESERAPPPVTLKSPPPPPPSAHGASVPPPVFTPPPTSDRGVAISEPPDSSPQIEAREVSMPPPKRGRRAKMVTLTLLDGTQINLPAKPRREPSAPAPKDGADLTARDLVAALRALSHGADASEILGDQARWEPLFAALLSLLMKKHVIADWEFVDEFKKV